jgi:hypothetical protein
MPLVPASLSVPIILARRITLSPADHSIAATRCFVALPLHHRWWSVGEAGQPDVGRERRRLRRTQERREQCQRGDRGHGEAERAGRMPPADAHAGHAPSNPAGAPFAPLPGPPGPL